MVFPDGSRAFIAAAGQPDKRYVEYPGGYHALLADVDRDRVSTTCGSGWSNGWAEGRPRPDGRSGSVFLRNPQGVHRIIRFAPKFLPSAWEAVA